MGEVTALVDLQRYLRNWQAISRAEQQLLAEKKLLVVGCGGLGGYLIEYLGRLGVGSLTVVDDDLFAESNLNRQLLATEAELGQPKAPAAARRLRQINPLVHCQPLELRITAENAATILSGHDLILDALDNVSSRLLLEQTAEQLQIPLVHGAIAGWCGQVASILPGDRLLQLLYANFGTEEQGEEVFSGNLGFTAGLVASLQAAEALKLLLQRGELMRHRLLQVDLLAGRFEAIDFRR